MLHDLGVFDTVEKLDCLRVIHHAGNRAIKSLGTQRGPNSCTKSELGGGALETYAIEWQIVHLGLTFLVSSEGTETIKDGGLLCEDLCIFHKVLPFDRVKLLEVFQKRDACVLILLANNLSKR